MKRYVVQIFIFWMLCMTAACPARAQEAEVRDWEAEAAIVAELDSIASDAVPAFESATRALDGEQYEAAEAGYREVLKKNTFDTKFYNGSGPPQMT